MMNSELMIQVNTKFL